MSTGAKVVLGVIGIGTGYVIVAAAYGIGGGWGRRLGLHRLLEEGSVDPRRHPHASV